MGEGGGRKRSEELEKKDRQKQGHKKRGPLGSWLLGGTEEGHLWPPEGAPDERRRREEEENIEQVTWGNTRPPSECSLMYNTVTSHSGRKASISCFYLLSFNA